MPLLLLIFIVIPLAEIAVFIQVGDAIGLGPTIAIVIITAIIGTALLRAQGFATLSRAQKTVSEGGIPIDSVIDGASLLVAGAFLLTPGMITDSLGFLLFVPAFRHWLAKLAFKKFTQNANINVNVFGNKTNNTDPRTDHNRNPHDFSDQPRPDGKGPVIDGEFEHIETTNNDPKNKDKT